MDNTRILHLFHGLIRRDISINHQPTLNEILSIIAQNFADLSQKAVSVAYKVNDEFRFALSDNDITSIFRSSGKDINLYVSVSQNDSDSILSSIESRISELSTLEKELKLLHQNYGSNVQAKQIEQEKLQAYYDEQIQSFQAKSYALEKDIERLKDAITTINAESARYKDSLKVLVSQYQSKIQEAVELKKDRDEKVILEAKVIQLKKELSDKQTESSSLFQRIQNITEERDRFSRKAEELETKQQTIESSCLHQASLQISSLPPEFSNPAQFVPSDTSSSLPFQVPSDISEMDVQVLFMAGIKLDTPSDQQKVFELLREKKDISQILESLM